MRIYPKAEEAVLAILADSCQSLTTTWCIKHNGKMLEANGKSNWRTKGGALSSLRSHISHSIRHALVTELTFSYFSDEIHVATKAYIQGLLDRKVVEILPFQK